MALLLGLVSVGICFGAVYAGDITFGRLLERQYSIAPAQWEKDGCPASRSWAAPGYEDPFSWSASSLYLFWWWAVVTPNWIKADATALRIHRRHRLYTALGLVGFMGVGITMIMRASLT
jgi:hypothetical protein